MKHVQCVLALSSRVISRVPRSFQLTSCFVSSNVTQCNAYISHRDTLWKHFTQQLSNGWHVFSVKYTRHLCLLQKCLQRLNALQMNQLNKECTWVWAHEIQINLSPHMQYLLLLGLPASLWYNLTHVDSSQEQKHTEQVNLPSAARKRKKKKKKTRRTKVNCSCYLYFLLN